MFLDLAKTRYSCKNYSDKPVEDDKLQMILEAARLAPTARNAQAQRLYVIKSKEAVEKLYACDTITHKASLAVVVCYEESEVYKNPFHSEINSGEVDAAIVATHMMLEAADLGVGSCWIGRLDYLEFRKVFDIPETVKPVCLILLGYPNEAGGPLPRHFEKKAMEDIVSYRWSIC